MSDILEKELLKKIESLPINKKKALLKLISETSGDKTPSFLSWKKQALKISTWSDSDIQAILDARAYINQWIPKSFF